MTIVETTQKLVDLAKREYEADSPNLDNCPKHKATKITERDIDCALCSADVRAMVLAALQANQWLCEWQEEVNTAAAELEAQLAAEADPPMKSEPDAGDPNWIPDDDLREMHRQSVIPVAYDNGTKITVGTMAGGAADPESHMMDGPLHLSLHIEDEEGKDVHVDYLRTTTFTTALLTKIADLTRSALLFDDYALRDPEVNAPEETTPV